MNGRCLVAVVRSVTFGGLLMLAATAAGADAITVFPRSIELTGRGASQRVVVQRVDVQPDDGARATGRQITEGLEFRVADPEIAVVEDGRVRALRNGETTLVVATAQGETARARVSVRGSDRERPVRFEAHVQSVLSKAGCNSGACHGALAGKGGFRLSLLGYDSAGDHFNITRQDRGRRLEPADPATSLILAKPSGAVAHKGGLRLPPESDDYRLVLDWVRAGAPGPAADDARLDRVEVLPEAVRLRPGDTQQLVVRAHYEDGSVEDVTRWARWNSTNEAVARVDDRGRVTVVGPGEGALSVWFASRIVLSRVAVPYEQEVPEEAFARLAPRNFIDRLVLDKLRGLNVPPSPRASDAEFLRRAYLDTLGVLPTAAEARAFLEDPRPGKRDALIDALLARPEFVDHWSYQWSDLLLLNGTRLRPEALRAFYHWIRENVEQNTPWDRFVRQILTARGDSLENGATNFYALHQDPENMTENTSQAFLGLSIACAKCHNHPLEKWTNDQYYAMANLFARVRAKGWGGDGRNGDGRRTLVVLDRGDLIQPLTGVPQPPAPLDAPPLPIDDPGDRRAYLAEWLTSPENPYFTRAITNRVWANFFGVGLVEEVDDLRLSNPASNEALLAAAADRLVEADFDLKALMRAILRSETYQRSSRPVPGNAEESRFYSRYYPRRMMAEKLLDAISQVTDVPTAFDQIEFPGADRQKTDFYPIGTRALQLYDSAVASYFLKTFGRNPREITCECERSDEPSVVQALHITNGATLNEKLAAEGNRIDRWIDAGWSDRRVLEEAFLAALSRRPTAAERQTLLAVLAESDDRRRALEDLLWGILSTKEFLFTH